MKNLNSGVHISPNIQTNSKIYELENIACDPEKLIEKFLSGLLNWKDKAVLDVGCGTGFHLPYYAKEASHVFAVEPHDESRLQAMQRVVSRGLTNISILKGSAEAILLESASIDFAYARFAYYWGNKNCLEGLKEVFRVLKNGGLFVMIDNNLEQGTFGSWVKESFKFADEKQSEVEQFWRSEGFSLEKIESQWKFKSREDLENVLSIEFSKELYSKIIKEHIGLSIDYTFNLYYKLKPKD